MTILKGRFERLLFKGILWLGILLLVVFSVFMAGVVWEVRGKYETARVERNNAHEAYAELENRFVSLADSVERFKNERGREEEFRKRFPVAKEGEEVIILLDPSEGLETPPGSQSRSWWGTIQSWFAF